MEDKPMNKSLLTASLISLIIFGAYAGRLSADEPEAAEHPVIAGVESPESQKERLERNRRMWENLPPEKKMELRKRFERWKNLAEPEKRKLRENMARLRRMQREQRTLLERRFGQLQKMAPERRMVLHRRLAMWQRIHPGKREKVRMFLGVLKRLPPEKIEELKKMPPPQRSEVIEELIRKMHENMAPGQGPLHRPEPGQRMRAPHPGK